MKRSTRIFWRTLGLLAYTGVFLAIRFGWTKVKDETDPNSSLYGISLRRRTN